jgi:hypothetical protein
MRSLLFAMGVIVLALWVRGEFGFIPSRSTAIARWYVHAFFLGIFGLSFLAFLLTFSNMLSAGVILMLASCTVLWSSIVLMMVHVVPLWFVAFLTIICIAVPCSLAGILQALPNSRFNKLWTLVLGLSAGSLLAMWIRPPWSLKVLANTRILDQEVRFWAEYQGLEHSTTLGRFRFDFMLWCLSGGPPHYPHSDYVSEAGALIFRENNALVDLGYFEKRSFPLNRVPVHEIAREVDKIPTKDGLWKMIPRKQDDIVTVYACKKDMAAIEAVFSRRAAGITTNAALP